MVRVERQNGANPGHAGALPDRRGSGNARAAATVCPPKQRPPPCGDPDGAGLPFAANPTKPPVRGRKRE
jgi:hypothetical protein